MSRIILAPSYGIDPGKIVRVLDDFPKKFIDTKRTKQEGIGVGKCSL